MIKFTPDKKYTTIAIYCLIVLSIISVFCYALFNLNNITNGIKWFIGILSPIIGGLIIAYLCNPIVKFFHKKVFSFTERKRPHRKLRHSLSVLCAYLVVVAFITIFISMVVPQVVQSYNDLKNNVDGYISAAQKMADEFVRNSPFFNGEYANINELIDVNEISKKLGDIITNSYDLISKAADYAINYSAQLISSVKNALLSIILSVYFLLSRDLLIAQTKKFINAIFDEKHNKFIKKLSEIGSLMDKMFGGYIRGAIADALIVALLTFIVMSIFKIPYAPLIAVIIGITNVIPFFGPYIGGIPSGFIVLISEPDKTILFAFLVLVVQQIDGNIICPKIMGNSTGLEPLWVIISITIAGGLFGIPGMILGIPAFAVIYSLISEAINKRLILRELPVSTRDYYAPGTFIEEPIKEKSALLKAIKKYALILWDLIVKLVKKIKEKIFSRKNNSQK